MENLSFVDRPCRVLVGFLGPQAMVGLAAAPMSTPAVDVLRGERKRHSLGSLYATLIWIALKTTPDLTAAQTEARSGCCA